MKNLLSKIIKQKSESSKTFDFEIIQQYSVSVLVLIIFSSCLAFNAVDLMTFAKIVTACATLIGFYSILFRFFRHHDISVLVFVSILVVLPFVPVFRYVLYLAALFGWLVLSKIKWRFEKTHLLAIPVLLISILGAGLYANFQYLHELSSGALHLDTLFHVSIAAMYKNYGVTSVGLNGLVPVAYHVLSHKIFAGISVLSGLEVLAIYSYIYFAMAPLLLMFVMAGFACQLNTNLKFSDALLGIALTFLIIIVLPIFQWAAMWDSFFVSESYLVALILLITSLSGLLRWVGNESKRNGHLVLSLMLLIFAGLAKASVGLIGLCVFGLLGITKYRYFGFWIILAIASFLFYLGVVDAANSAKELMPISPLHFVATYIKASYFESVILKLTFFLIVHFSVVWLCFVIGFNRLGA